MYSWICILFIHILLFITFIALMFYINHVQMNNYVCQTKLRNNSNTELSHEKKERTNHIRDPLSRD